MSITQHFVEANSLLFSNPCQLLKDKKVVITSAEAMVVEVSRRNHTIESANVGTQEEWLKILLIWVDEVTMIYLKQHVIK